MKHLHLAMDLMVPSSFAYAIVYGAEGEYDLKPHELDMLHRFQNEKLDRCYSPILDWSDKERTQVPDHLFQLHHEMPCKRLRVWCPIPFGMNRLYHKMKRIANMIRSFRYDFTIYDIHSLFSNPVGTPFLWSVSPCGTHIGMMNMERAIEYIDKYPQTIDSFRHNSTWMDGVFSTCVFGSEHHAYWYDGKHLMEVTREFALDIQHRWNKKVYDTYTASQTRKSA